MSGSSNPDVSGPGATGPQAHIIAGPNGAGKTTFAREFLPEYAHCGEFLNTDLVAAGLSPFNPDAAAVAAGRVLLARMRELIRQRTSFGFETTLAGKRHLRVFRDMKAKGYRLHLFHLWLPSGDIAVARVARRVAEGGHNVPEDVIRRRSDAGLRSLFRLYLPLFDSWLLFDSSTLRPRVVARHERGKTEVLDAVVYQQIQNASRGRTGQ